MPLSRKTVQAVNPVLTAFMNDYRNAEFIGDKVFPIIPVANEMGTYYTFTSKDSFRLPTIRRAPGANYKRLELSVTTGTYTCEEDGAEIPVDRRLEETAVKPLDPRKLAAQRVADIVLLRREKNIIDVITNATTFASYTAALAGTDRWDDDNSEPLKQFNTRALTIRDNCGHMPNTMVVSTAVYLKLREHPVIVDKIAYDKDKIITPEMLRQFFGVDKFLISSALYNSAQEGQTVSLTEVMGKQVFLGWINPTPALNAPSVGYLIQKSAFVGDEYYEEQTKQDIVRGAVIEVPKVVAADCGFLLTTVIS